jgi:hypothetical protein
MAIKYEQTTAEREFNLVHDLLNDYWKNIAINIFEWKRKNGEPLETISEGLTSTQIEEELYDKGSSLFFKDENIGYMALPVAPANKLNVYRKPTKFRAIGNNYTKEYDVDNSVLIKNNTLKKATFDIVDYYTSKLADIELTKDLHRNAHKTPLILECTEDTLLSAKNTFKKVRANEPVIYKNKTRGEDIGVNVLNANVPYINDKLEDDYHNYEARILTALGLDNYVEDKKERVQSAEVESQQEYIISSFRASLNERKKACEAINKMFGLDLEVDYVKAEQIETDEPVNESEEVTDNE